jgi:cysteine desulfurase/selenocysteine lyase
MLDVDKIRKDFPILKRKINGKPLVYFDNAATSQKPQSVINAITHYYEYYNANIHRGVHTLSEEATEAYESSRSKVRNFIGAKETKEIIFTRNATEAINLVAYSWARQHVLPGDEIVLSPAEHHSNFVPWQILAQERGAKLVFLDLDAEGIVDLNSAAKIIGPKTKLLTITQMSNVLGTIMPVAQLAEMAHKQGAIVLVDGAQSLPHLPVDMQKLGADFFAFSFHKMLGPTGVGVLWGKASTLESMPPFLSGGDMISSVWRDKVTFNSLPWRFEAGTPNIADVIGSGAAITYLQALGMENVHKYEQELTEYALAKLSQIDNLAVYGTHDVNKRGGLISFNMAGIHPHDLGQILSESGICIRVGHHCCQPLMRDLNVSGTARASFYVYNTKEEIDSMVEALKEAQKVLGHVACK